MILLNAAPFDFTLIFVMMIVFLIIQFIIVGPKQKKKEKENKEFIANLPNGAKVMTSSGIYGKLVKKDEQILHIEVDTGTTIKIDINFIHFEVTKTLNASA
jgi:preprotein translocase subunit YajC